jgi:hypothetical protein
MLDRFLEGPSSKCVTPHWSGPLAASAGLETSWEHCRPTTTGRRFQSLLAHPEPLEIVVLQQAMKITIPEHLSNDELLAGLQHLAASERRGTAQLVAHLVELETRGLHLKAAFTSLFAYCCEALHLSEDAAYNRIEAARAARRFPVILDMLDSGELSVTTARMLGRILTLENHAKVLAAASGQSKRAVEELVVQYAPRPDVPTSLRKVSERTATSGTPSATTIAPERSAPALPAPTSRPEPAPAPSRPASVTPLAPSRYELKVTVSQETRDKLRLAQDLLRHAIPSGDTAEILDRALTLLLADVARKKFAATQRPRPSRAATTDSREPAAHVKRAVCQRDDNRCAYVARRAPLQYARLLGIPPPEDVRQRRSGHRRQPGPQVSPPQPVRGRRLLRGDRP